MFDIGALELILIGVVALIVVGPERLPKLARTAGFWAGRARRAFVSVKDEIDREIKSEELKEILRKQAASNPLEQIIEDDGALGSRGTGTKTSPSSGTQPRTPGDPSGPNSAADPP